ncbi:uncharacterized protein LOC131887172 [Tigriopus californicus]|uniref:uncharacterized protein LOC131887172 n=1 Tax=Tigriopus californicus TaxID=6832 RepID=UPI0027DA2C0A|nr:uncharacterized protein LOC131887172 [Tigriopus californicus]
MDNKAIVIFVYILTSLCANILPFNLIISNDLRSFQNLTMLWFGYDSYSSSTKKHLVKSRTRPRNETRTFAKNGTNINCEQSPFPAHDLQNDEFFFVPSPDENPHFAYAWYISEAHYLCSALVSMKRLKALRAESKFPYPVDFVMVHTKEDRIDNTPHNLVKQWETEGGIRVSFPSLRGFITNSYYKTSLQKFHIFLLNYTRVISMDADGVALNNMDHLFLLKLPQGVRMAAPQGYWFNNEGFITGDDDTCKGVNFPLITSILLLIEPSKELYSRVVPYFGKTRPVSKLEYFDMDIIQSEFNCKTNDIMVLPKMYGTLDSDFYKTFKIFQNYRKCLDFSQVQYLHFSHQGKPWTRGLSQVRRQYGSSNLHSNASSMFVQWFRDAHMVCPNLLPELSG